MSTLTDRRLLAFCGISALVGVPAAVLVFPDDGAMILVVPIVVLAVLMFVDGYARST